MDEIWAPNNSLTAVSEYNDTFSIQTLLLSPIMDTIFQDESKRPVRAGVISDVTLEEVSYYLNFMSAIICLCGSIFNIITIIVYFRMGLKDSVNILLFSLAVTDLGAILLLLWKAILANPYVHNWELLPFDPVTFIDYTSGFPHVCFVEVSALITAVVTLDRYMCVVMPLQVKLIITPRRAIIIVVMIVIYIIGTVTPLYTRVSIGYVYFPDRNKTLIAFIHAPDALHVIESTFIFGIIHQTIVYIFIVIVTTLLVIQLNKKSAWRKQFYRAPTIPDVNNDINSSNSSPQPNSVSARDVKVVKMILLISTLYIVCYLPTTINPIVMVASDDYNFYGRYENLLYLVWAICNNLIAINSTVNIFIYFKMSSKFANEFLKMFGRTPDKDGITK